MRCCADRCISGRPCRLSSGVTANQHADDREPRRLQPLVARASVAPVRVLVACGMSLLVACGGATAVGDGQGPSDVRIVPGFTFSPGNFNRPETSETAPSPCFRLTFLLRPTAPVF